MYTSVVKKAFEHAHCTHTHSLHTDVEDMVVPSILSRLPIPASCRRFGWPGSGRCRFAPSRPPSPRACLRRTRAPAYPPRLCTRISSRRVSLMGSDACFCLCCGDVVFARTPPLLLCPPPAPHTPSTFYEFTVVVVVVHACIPAWWVGGLMPANMKSLLLPNMVDLCHFLFIPSHLLPCFWLFFFLILSQYIYVSVIWACLNFYYSHEK